MSESMKIALIEWIDSKGVTSDWEHLEDLTKLEPVLVRSVGFLLKSNDDYKTLTQSVGLADNPSDIQVCGRITIPAVCIKSIKILKESA